jgi:hypothetical protein
VQASALTDVLVGKPQPAMALGLGDHCLEQTAIGLLGVGASRQLAAGIA